MPTDSTTVVADVELSDEVRAFCQSRQLLHHLGRAIELARQYFSIVGDPVVKLEQDPEVDEQYLVLEIRVSGDEDESIQAHKAYNRTWANSTRWPECHMISLFVDLIAA
jgi:hypothetical protein